MKEIKKLVTELSGHRGRECYYILCLAVAVALDSQPAEPQMKQVWAEVRIRSGKNNPKTISRALSRAVDDIWEHGARGRLCEIFGRPVEEKPSPKDVILVLAQYIWNSRQEAPSSSHP